MRLLNYEFHILNELMRIVKLRISRIKLIINLYYRFANFTNEY